VADEGQGIAPWEHERVLERAWSAQAPTGFGLAIVRQIVEAHNCAVRLHSAGRGAAVRRPCCGCAPGSQQGHARSADRHQILHPPQRGLARSARTDSSALAVADGVGRWHRLATRDTRTALEGDAQAQEALGHPALEGLEPGDGRRQLRLDRRQPLLNAVLDLAPFDCAGRGPARVRAGRSVVPLAGAGSALVHVCGAGTRGLACRGTAALVRCCASSTRRRVRPCLAPGRARRMRCRVRIDDAARKPPALSRDKAVLPSPLAHVRRSRCRHGILLTRREVGDGRRN
jgi:hypothetical protein